MECTYFSSAPNLRLDADKAPSPRPALSALVVSRDREVLTSCCYKLGSLETHQIAVHGAPSTELGSRMFEWKHYEILLIDPRGIDWHRLQLHAARCALTHHHPMPIVAILKRDGAIVPHQWGEGNDYDEALNFPLRRQELESFLDSCAGYYIS